MANVYTTTMPSPIGTLQLCASDQGLTHVFHANQQSELPSDHWVDEPKQEHLAQARGQLEEYFATQRTDFAVTLAPEGTPFQLAVWEALKTIPYGQTSSYTDIAEHIGKPKAVRAVGAANGRNPLSIFVPCHRVIGKSGTLTGYAGGLDKKSILLALEQGEQSLF